MKKYIDRQLFLDNVKHNAPFLVSLILPIILITPTADVVPVVRCRECKHCGNFKDYNNKTIFKVCLLGGGLTAVPDNHYCGYGEKK